MEPCQPRGSIPKSFVTVPCGWCSRSASRPLGSPARSSASPTRLTHVRHALPLREDVVARRCGLVRREAVLTSSLYLIAHLDADPLQRAQLASRLGVVDDAVIGILTSPQLLVHRL